MVVLAFSLPFPRNLWVRQGKIILGKFEDFLDKNQKIKERKDRFPVPVRFLSHPAFAKAAFDTLR